MPIHDFRCPAGHVSELLVKSDVTVVECPECGNLAELKFLVAPKLDWMSMAQGENAGPEFIARFDRAHKQRREQEQKHKAEHGDNMRGAGG